VTCDVTTKLIPAFTIGDRTQPVAHRLLHDLSQRLAAGELPVFSSDGLALYYYALTAHFGQWVQAASQHRRYWQVRPDLFYAQLVKRSRRRRLVVVDRRICLGQLATFRARLQAIGLTGCIQTAFIERLNLTIRRSLAALARRSWSAARSERELTLQFDWWRAVYHFTRPHVGLRQGLANPPIGRTRRRYRQRTPAQAASLTQRRWTVLELLLMPAPPLNLG
jgi:IS1 family transposase